MILLLFLKKHGSAHQLERLYRSGLSQLRMPPSHRLSESEIRSAVATSPTSAGIAIATHKTAVLMTAAATVAGGVCVWQVVRNTPQENATPSVVETHGRASLQPEEPEQLSVSDTTVTENAIAEPVETLRTTSLHQTQDASDPVVITREIPVTRTVVLHDTITVTDTIFLIHHD